MPTEKNYLEEKTKDIYFLFCHTEKFNKKYIV